MKINIGTILIAIIIAVIAWSASNKVGECLTAFAEKNRMEAQVCMAVIGNNNSQTRYYLAHAEYLSQQSKYLRIVTENPAYQSPTDKALNNL